jgi:hypothetical protein
MKAFFRHVFLALVGVLFGACSPPGPVVYVAVEFVAPKGTRPLKYIEITSGAERIQIGDIEPGIVDHSKIYPGARSTDNELTLSIYLHPKVQESIDWQGARLPQGSSYKTHIRIDAKGQVLSQRSCVVPCEL